MALNAHLVAWMVSNAMVSNGALRVMQLCGFNDAIKDADLIVTGEGKSDAQSLMGKVPFALMKHSGGVPVMLLSGRIEDRCALEQAGFCEIIEITPRDLPLKIALGPVTATDNIRSAIHNSFGKQ